MLHYWYTVLKILVMRRFRPALAFDQSLERTFRVRLMDCKAAFDDRIVERGACQ